MTQQEMVKRVVALLVKEGKVVLPCGEYTVKEIEVDCLLLRGPRGRKVTLDPSPRGVSGHPDAIAFALINERTLDVTEYALLVNGGVLGQSGEVFGGCDCPLPGANRGCSCRVVRYPQFKYRSDDWCNCKCHK